MMHLSLYHTNIGLEIGVPRHRIQNRICSHSSHTKVISNNPGFGTEQKFSLPKHGDFMWPPLTIQIPIKPHGHIPNTSETYEFVNFVINGTMALHMLGLDIMELYNEILKYMVPPCYNLWKLIEKVHRSMVRVKNPRYMQVVKAHLLNPISRKATPADFGIMSTKRNQKNRRHQR